MKLSTDIGKFYASHETDHPRIDARLKIVIRECVARQPRTILDIGCGRGTLLTALAERLPDVRAHAIELSPSLAAQARSRGINVFEQDLSGGIPLPDASTDIVVMGEVIEHLFDPDASIDEIRRVLRPDGTLIVTTPNLASWANRILLFAGIQPLYTETSTRKKYGRLMAAMGQGSTQMEGHLRVFTAGALTQMLGDLGFRVQRIFGAPFMAFSRNPITAAVDAMFCLRPSLASVLVVVARKSAHA